MKFAIILTALLIALVGISAHAPKGESHRYQIAPLFQIGNERIFSPGEQATMYFRGYLGDISDLRVTSYQILDPIAFFSRLPDHHAPGYAIDSVAELNGAFNVNDLRRFHRVGSSTERIGKGTRWVERDLPLPMKTSGAYVVTAIAGNRASVAVVVITDNVVIVKRAPGEALAFVANRRTGERVKGVNLRFRFGAGKTVDAVTGADGAAHVSVDGISDEIREPVSVFGRAGGNFVLLDAQAGRNSSRDAIVYLHTDRPVYRPSQTVYYRGIARKPTDEGYTFGADDSARIKIIDARGATIKDDRVAISDMGTFSGEFTLDGEPPLGGYGISAEVGDRSGMVGFDVQEYKKPEYEVHVRTDRSAYLRGDTVTVTIDASYYFGSPVSDADISYAVFRSHASTSSRRDAQWEYLMEPENVDVEAGSRMIHTGAGKLDAAGRLTFAYPIPADSGRYSYVVQATVVDPSRRAISGTTSFMTASAAHDLICRPLRTISKPGEEILLSIEARSFDSDQPIALPFEARVTRTWWKSLERSHEIVWRGSATTGADGTGRIRFTPVEQGYYTFQITSRDRGGNPVATSIGLYVAEQGFTGWQAGEARIIPDREYYKPGDTMTALLLFPAAGADVLLTAEGMSIQSHRVERIGAGAAMIRMKMEERSAPNFMLTATTVAQGTIAMASKEIIVAPVSRVLTLDIETDKEQYRPGDRGSVTVRALDADGKPARDVDIALSMVDEAVYAIRPDMTPDIRSAFLAKRPVHVVTSVSTNFRFQPRPKLEPPMVTVTSDRNMAIRGMRLTEATSVGTSYSISADLMTATPMQTVATVQPTLRSSFKDLMRWTPSVRTGRDGRAVVAVEFPDNLTSWRITARGVNRVTAVGQARLGVVSRKDVLVRMETPRFIVQGDELMIATTVHNYLDSAKRVDVRVQGEGIETVEPERSVTVPAGSHLRIDWPVKAIRSGTAVLTAHALTDEESDAMRVSVPVLPQGVRQGAGATADMRADVNHREMRLAIPSNADPSAAVLKISLVSSTAGAMLGALDDLIGYPYGCAEQTMSRFLPTVVVTEALRELNLPFDQSRRNELPKMVSKGLDRLYSFQHKDGGWGWWEHDATNPFMTAYIMYGLTVAQRAGYEVDEQRYKEGRRSLRKQIESRAAGGNYQGTDASLRSTTESYMLYVLSMVDEGKRNAILDKRIRKMAELPDINSYTRAILAVTAVNQKLPDLTESLARKLRSEADGDASHAFWSGATWEHGWHDDQVETSAWALKALLATDTESEAAIVDKGVRWLLAQRRGSSWSNTRQTAMAIYSLIDYLKGSGEANPEFTVTVNVNGAKVATCHMGRNEKSDHVIEVDPKLLLSGENIVTLGKSGSGMATASASLSYFATGRAIEPSQAGFAVRREYYLLRRVRRDGDYIYRKEPFTGVVQSGAEILVRVRFTPDKRNEYIMLEDPLPAGCEVVGETDGYVIEGERDYSGAVAGVDARGAAWNWWYAARDVRDEKIAFFASAVEPREYECSYILRAQIPGRYSVMPPVVCLMYYPEVRGSGGMTVVNITE